MVEWIRYVGLGRILHYDFMKFDEVYTPPVMDLYSIMTYEYNPGTTYQCLLFHRFIMKSVVQIQNHRCRSCEEFTMEIIDTPRFDSDISIIIIKNING